MTGTNDFDLAVIGIGGAAMSAASHARLEGPRSRDRARHDRWHMRQRRLRAVEDAPECSPQSACGGQKFVRRCPDPGRRRRPRRARGR